MSGYLQRLARAVMQPAETVHPVVGSLFSAPDDRSGRSGPSAGTSLVEQSESTSANETQNNQEFRLMRAPLRSQSTPATKDTLVLRLNSTALPAGSHETSKRDEREAAWDIGTAQEIREPHENGYAPLMAINADRLGRPNSNPSFMGSPSLGRREREPDEIQIHIGRIEVLAVPQATGATAAKVPRKASSLDEYLKRRDRRTL